MDRLQTIDANGQRIIFVDLSAIKPAESLAVMSEARVLVSSQPPKSVLLMTDVTNASYNAESADAMKAFSKGNTPFVRRSAVVGATGLRAVVLAAIRILTGREIRTFDTRDAAMEWLTTRS